MSSLDEYLAARRESRSAATGSLDPETDRAVAATETRVARAATAAYADGYSSEQLADAEAKERSTQ